MKRKNNILFIDTSMKTCKTCERKLSISEFYSHPTTKDKLTTKCKKCYCKQEANRSRAAYKEKLNSETCIRCGQKRIDNRFCKKHLLMEISCNRLGTRKRWKEIQELLEKQESKCAYTGQKIALHKNASLEHKIPTSRGGTHDVNNLFWIDTKINIMKNNMLMDEFIEFIDWLSLNIKRNAQD